LCGFVLREQSFQICLFLENLVPVANPVDLRRFIFHQMHQRANLRGGFCRDRCEWEITFLESG
jgi:hypothetical protein